MKEPGEGNRERDPKWLDQVRQMNCLICKRRPTEAHHLTHVQEKARGLKAGDQFVVPLCSQHHNMLHRAGDEARWWIIMGVDPVEWIGKWTDLLRNSRRASEQWSKNSES